MPTLDNNPLKFKHNVKTTAAPLALYSDLECLLKETEHERKALKNNESYTQKVHEQILCGFSLITICLSDSSKNLTSHYRGEYCMKKFCDYIEEHVNTIMNYKKAETINLTRDKSKNNREQNTYGVCNDLLSKTNKKYF